MEQQYMVISEHQVFAGFTDNGELIMSDTKKIGKAMSLANAEIVMAKLAELGLTSQLAMMPQSRT